MNKLFAALLLSLAANAAHAQASAFVYNPERAVPPGTVWHYVKSNRDGSDPWKVDRYVASPTRIDVVKWREGAVDFVEVAADMDIARAMPVAMQQWNTMHGRRAPTMWGTASADGLRIQLADGRAFEIPGKDGPLHMWGFDLMGLSLLLPHLADPDRAFELEVIDPNRPGTEGRMFAQGIVRFEPDGSETIDGVDCRRYKLVGAVFGDAPGHIWVDRATGRLERAEHAVPTSTDWNDWKLDLVGVEPMDGFGWENFKLGLADAQGGGGKSAAAAMKSAYDKDGIAAALATIAVARTDAAEALQDDLNTFGYALLGSGKHADAIAVFEQAAREWPQSANAWDSLGEAQAEAGQRDAAIASYQRVLKLKPDDAHAKERIAALKKP